MAFIHALHGETALTEAETKINLPSDHSTVIAPSSVRCENQTRMAVRLDKCWPYLAGSDDGGMKARKLRGRLEKFHPRPMISRFRNQRKGDA